MPSYKLNYFDVRARGEVIRMMFTMAGTKFEDKRIDFKDWPAEKEKLGNLGQLPVLEIDGKAYIQTKALINYVAGELGFCGKTAIDRLRCEEMVSTADDLLEKIAGVVFEKDEAEKAEKTKKLLEEIFPKYLSFIEKRLGENKTGFITGADVTSGDLAVYDVLVTPVKRYTGLLDKYPKIAEMRTKVENHPKLKAYLASRPVTDM